MRTTLRVLLVCSVVAALASACNGNSAGGPSSSSSSSGSAALTGSYTGHGSYINPIDFDVANGVVTGVHGMVSVNCVSAPSTVIEDSQFSDGDTIRLNSTGAFSDDYRYMVGQGQWTLHVQGQLYSNGSASGFLYVHGVGCSTSTNGWAAARTGVPLPPIPTNPPSSPAAACSPQPCENKDNVTVSVQSASLVTKNDDPSVKGVDVEFSVYNHSNNGISIINTSANFSLKFDNGDVADHSWAYFVDASGQDVPCIRGAEGITVLPGNQLQNQHLCFVLPRDESGQQASFVWELFGGPPFVIPVGTPK